MKDYLTMHDSELAEFGRRFSNGVEQISSVVNVSNDEMNELKAAIDDFENNLNQILATRTQLKSLTLRKNNSQKQIKARIRSLSKKARANVNVSAQDLAKMGLKPHDRTRTRIEPPSTAPYILVEIRRNRQHIISIFDSSDSSVKSKPKDVTGAEIWVYVGEQDVLDEKNMRYIGTSTRHRLAFTHEAEDTGKQAHYLARWVNRRGERGGWSNLSSGTIVS